MKVHPLQLIILQLIALALPLDATQTGNHGIHAVPAQGKVTIDGKLDDWDLSGQVLMCYDIETLRNTYSAEIAMMHDTENLYVSIHWKSPAPMGNPHHPRYEAAKAWAADAVQLRIKTDRISHLTAWYYAPGDEPAIMIDYGKSLTEPFKGGSKQLFRTAGWKLEEGVEMAFQKDADDHGYVQEIKLPWKLITLEKRPQIGGQFGCGIELLWGSGDWPAHRYADNLQPGKTSREFFWMAHNDWGPVFMESHGRLSLPEPDYVNASNAADEPQRGPVEIRYTLPKTANVTLAIDDAGGNRVRNLIAYAPRGEGANTERWDGLDDHGKPVPPGAYRFTAIYHDGIHVNYVMSFANPGVPSWDTADGRGAFYGDHTAPEAVAAAGDYVALACPMGESGKHLIVCNLDGRRLWGLSNRAAFDGGRISLATDGKILWVATEGRKSIIYRVDIATGKYAPWHAKAKDAQGNEFELLDLQVSDQPGAGTDPTAAAAIGARNATAGLEPNMRSIAYRDNTLAICFARENKLELRDATTGGIKSRFDVQKPRSVVFNNDGSLVVLADGGHLLQIAPDGAITRFAMEAFPDGYSLTRDGENAIYLSVRGADQNVKVFSPAEKRIREIGKHGGRPAYGPFDANAMRNPAQIAIDSKGRLWVAEETMNPKRTSVWNPGDGSLIRDFIGTTSYAAAGAINPDDPTMAFSEGTIYEIDLKTGTWRPSWSLARRDDPRDLFPPRATSLKNRVITRNGKTYVFNTSSTSGGGGSEVTCTMFDGKTWRSAACVAMAGKKRFPAHDGEIFAWVDRNGDGLVQDDEVSFSKLVINGKPASLGSYFWGQLPGPDGTIIYMAKGVQALVEFPITGFSPCGAPVYDASHPTIVPASQIGGHGSGEGSIMGGGGGRVYLNQNPLITITREGKVLGGYPNNNLSVHGSHTATPARPGYLIGPSSILGTADFGGEIGEVFALNGNLGQSYLFTSDGLIIQSLFKDVRGGAETPDRAERGMPMDNTSAGSESFGGNFVRTRDGKVYLTIGATDARVLEVTGLESIHRLAGPVNFTPAQYAEAQRMATEKTARNPVSRLYKIAKAPAPPLIDGKPDEWPELLDDKASAAEIQDSGQNRHARVAVRYDRANLYVAWRVFSPAGRMRNSGQDWRLLFKTGDAVDFMLGADPQKPGGTGNQRLLVSISGNNPIAVLNVKTAPGSSPNERYEFTSPSRSIPFDRVVRVPVQVAVGAIPGGYMVEAAVPWKTLDIEPAPGLKLKGDFGVLFADAGGTQTISRQYWSNKSTGLVSDVPGEADLAPELWGKWELEK